MKTKTEHTPGPWVARKGDVLNTDRSYGVVKYLSKEAHREIDGDDMVYPSRTEVIAEICEGPTDEADANLIAAAPAMLEALRELTASIDAFRSSLREFGLHVVTPPRMDDAYDQAIETIAKAEGR